ncbi:MAG: MotA/TolQ/ExbB proton channel family protein [Planctomycetota bacterium]|jgi:biopolymer transport protein ExbB
MPQLGFDNRLSTFRSIVMGALFCMAAFVFVPAQAFAWQDAAEEEATEEVVDDGEAVEEAVDDGGADGGDEAPPLDEDQSFLSWMIEASGIFGGLILLLSFMMVALVMMNILQVRRDNFVPQAFIEQFEQRLNARDFQGAYEQARADDSLVARVLAAGLAKVNLGYDRAVEGMQEVGDDENMALEHRLSYLALISAIAPMLGLMGTVYGMIMSFRVIATSPTTPKPSELAGGISSALFTTLEGLVVAIPAMVFYAILRNRIARFIMEVSMVSEGLMSRFAQAGRQQQPQKPAGGAAPAGAPAAPQQ